MFYYLCVMNVVDQNINTIRNLCLKHKVNKLYVFGSVLSGTFNQSSDIDLIVSFKEVILERYADNYFDFKFSLEDLFERNVDLIEDKAIKNPFLRKSIDSTKKLVYG